MVLVYTDADFRAAFPFFADTTMYPEARLQQNFVNGSGYISTLNYGAMVDANRQQALYLITAHVTVLQDALNAAMAGQTMVIGILTQAKIDKVTVTVQPPVSKNAFQYWLNLTPYGQALLALLAVQSAGGWQVGGNPERQAFRRVAGGFGGPRWPR